MTNVKKLPSCIVLQYEWNLTHFNQKKAPLFSKETIESNHEMDCTVKPMNRFIKFIYTGKFEGSDGELLKLASKYEIDTLENLCKAASQDTSLKEMCSLAMHLGHGPVICA